MPEKMKINEMRTESRAERMPLENLNIAFFRVRNPDGQMSVHSVKKNADGSFFNPSMPKLSKGEQVPNWSPGYTFEEQVSKEEGVEILRKSILEGRVAPVFEVTTDLDRHERIISWNEELAVSQWSPPSGQEAEEQALSSKRIKGEFYDYGTPNGADMWIGPRPADLNPDDLILESKAK